MALIYPITLPSNPAAQSVELSIRAAIGRGRNPFNQSVQLDDWGAQKIFASISLPPMSRAQGEPWLAALLAAQLGDMTFLLGPMGDQATPRGIATGPAPTVIGAGQTGVSLITRGWTPSQTGILKAGDWLQLGRNYLVAPLDAMEDAAWTKNQCTAAGSIITPTAGATDTFVKQIPALPAGVLVASRAWKLGVFLRAVAGTPSITIFVINQATVTRGSLVCALTTSWQFFALPVTMDAADTGVGLQVGGGNSWVEADGAVDASGVYLDATDQNQRLHKTMSDQNSDANGVATLDICPELREATEDFVPIVVANPKGVFQLSENELKWLHQPGAILNGVTFLAEEAI